MLEFEVLKPGQKERLKQLREKDAKNVGVWYLVVKKKKQIRRRRRVRLKEDTSGLKREDIMFQIRHFYLQPKW